MRYEIHCDECKKIIGDTNSLKASAQGGVCVECDEARYIADRAMHAKQASELGLSPVEQLRYIAQRIRMPNPHAVRAA